MEDKTTVDTGATQALIDSYLEAFRARDLDRCVGYFDDNASLKFVSGVYNGRQAIEDWHKERFAAELKILSIDSVNVDGDTVKIDLMLASKRLQFFRLPSLAARATIRLDNNKIKEAHFGPRFTDPFEGW